MAQKIIIKLKPNSMYHQILVKNLGQQGAKQALLNSHSGYLFGYSTYQKVLKHRKAFAKRA